MNVKFINKIRRESSKLEKSYTPLPSGIYIKNQGLFNTPKLINVIHYKNRIINKNHMIISLDTGKNI